MPNVPEDEPLLHLQVAETRQRLTAAILCLPARERLVFTLYYYEGLTTEEIELISDEAPSRISDLHASALLHLNAQLADSG